MKCLQIYSLVLLLLSLVGCLHTPHDLQRAERLMESDPDSSLHILQHISPNNYISNSDRALYGLLMFQAQDKNYLPLTPDKLIDFSIDYYQDEGEKSRLAAACLYKARMYKYASRYEDATLLLMKALDNADKATDHALLGRIYADLGAICFSQQDYLKARTDYTKAYMYYAKANLKEHSLEALLDVGRTHYAMQKYDSAAQYYKQALSQATDSLSVGSCMLEMAENHYTLKQYDSALYYLRPLIHYPYISNNCAIRYSLLADVHFDLKQLDSACFYARGALKNRPDIETRQSCYRILGKAAFERKEIDKMSQYINLYAATSDSINQIDLQTKVSVIEKMHQDKKAIKTANRNSIILGLFLFLVLLSGIVILYYLYRQNKQNKQTQDEQIHQVQHRLVQKQNTLVSELKQQLEKEKSRQADTRLNATPDERDALVIALYQSKLHLNDWTEFTRLMNYTYNNVVSTLENSCPDIKNTEIIWCCLHLLDVSHAEKMILLQTSSGSLYKMKQRLASKLNLNGAKMLDEYLFQFNGTTIS